MIANNFFRALGDFFTNAIFPFFEKLRFTDSWWASNTINITLIIIGFLAFIFWMSQLNKYRKGANL
ncbi:MAG: uracil phosphoribosyltransferase [Flavobacteriaceae bacterium]|nr:uracil phosphoribosyltransferase [Flavobacteriaceae bacterium]